MSRSLSVVSLYSGAGGLDLGFERAGYRLLWANDRDRYACETYQGRLGDHIVHGELESVGLPTGLRPDVVIGGPPCQGFSVAGRMDPSDGRSQHVFRFLDAVGELAPRAFVMENVKALAVSGRWREVRGALLDRAREMGYSMRPYVLQSADYGVAQLRERVFFIGLYGQTQPTDPVVSVKPPVVTVREALMAVPTYGSPGNDTRCGARVVPAPRPVLRASPYQGSLLFNGSGRPLDLDGLARTLPASMSGNATPIIDQEELEFGAEPWVVGYHERLLAKRPPLPVAPPRLRRITVEEAAVLQGFPPGLKFAGPPNAQYRQIGNSVPPPMAERVARVLRADLS